MGHGFDALGLPETGDYTALAGAFAAPRADEVRTFDLHDRLVGDRVLVCMLSGAARTGGPQADRLGHDVVRLGLLSWSAISGYGSGQPLRVALVVARAAAHAAEPNCRFWT